MAAYADAVDKMGSDPDWRKLLARLGSRVASVDLSILRPLADSPLK